jgi:hypothetical protein
MINKDDLLFFSSAENPNARLQVVAVSRRGDYPDT